jgi:glutathione reductase (NADPH)
MFSVAIAAGRKLSHRLFNNEPDSKLDYENIPSVVFTHPPIGKK